MILAKVPNFTPECLWIVGSVYVGHSGATTNYSRREAFASIRQALDRVVPFDNNHPVLIFGDWNTDPQRLQRIVHSWGHGLTVMQFSGSQITRLSTVHGRRHSSIDHFVCNAPAHALLTSPRVDRQTAVADHFVIRTSIRAEAQGQPSVPRAPIISRHHCLEATDRIATSNYWDVLADGAADDTNTDTNIHQLTSQFLESANAVADNLSLRLSPPATRSNRRLLSGATKRAILASNTARQAFIAAATHTNLTQSSATLYKMSDGRTDLVFAAARAMSGNSSRSAAVTPLYNSDGIVQYDPTSILRVMQGHYGSLAADTIGHSLDLQYWHDRQPIQVSRDTPTIRNSDILDQDFSWNQIAAALLQMSPRKAPGDDGISTAFYQAALYMPANTQEGVPPTPFARALLRKDGDPLNPGEKRGIALINAGLKLVCKVLQMRIERFVETNNLLSYEQAGFRKREEFPVGALLWKLQNMGFTRRTLAFLKALYTSSSSRARAGSLLSDPFPVQRGVRQGCPLSGLLFNLFINDILNGVAPITVPGLPQDTTPSKDSCTQTMLPVFAGSEQSLLAASTAVEQWANQWEMQFGVAKCGIISFTGHLAPRLDNTFGYSTPWTVANGELPFSHILCRVMGKAYYGLELVGSNKSHLATTADDNQQGYPTVHWCPTLDCHWTPFWLNWDWVSSHSLIGFTSTLVGAICDQENTHQRHLLWNRYWLTPTDQTKDSQATTLVCIDGDSTNMWRLCIAPKYVTRQFLDTSGFFKDPSFDQSRAHGTRYLMLARMDALWTARKAIQIGILVDTHPFSVDHCILCDQHYSAHPLPISWWSVSKWENVYTWLRGGVLNGEADLDQRWLDGTVEHESMGTRHDNRALAARLADFLQVAYWQYQSTLWKYHQG
ncbi:hypothetical protein BASA60_003578 [Batrachochytrium salamandrivorans]|nr:hypothetical protein BASA60_003578 [Batrachochytrium salamandrivorans]